MATIHNEGMGGLIGQLVMYNLNGKQIARTRPGLSQSRRKQLAKSSQAIVFGRVSRYGTALMQVLKDHLLFSFTHASYNAVRGWLRNQYAPNLTEPEWPVCSRFNTTCQLNPLADLRHFLKAGIEISDAGNGQIRITMEAFNPVQQILPPAGTGAVKLKWIVLSSSFGEGANEIHSAMQEYSFPYTNAVLPEKQTQLRIGGSVGDIVLVVMAMEFEMKQAGVGAYAKDIACMPAAIMAIGKRKE
ncbi:MAG: hypothetical protein V4450_15380 [Bacteroidota bacterium]